MEWLRWENSVTPGNSRIFRYSGDVATVCTEDMGYATKSSPVSEPPFPMMADDMSSVKVRKLVLSFASLPLQSVHSPVSKSTHSKTVASAAGLLYHMAMVRRR